MGESDVVGVAETELAVEAAGSEEGEATELGREHPDATRSTNVAATALSISLMLAAVPPCTAA
jgi:hypothetical protein